MFKGMSSHESLPTYQTNFDTISTVQQQLNISRVHVFSTYET